MIWILIKKQLGESIPTKKTKMCHKNILKGNTISTNQPHIKNWIGLG
jgi:hypothetical protein